MNDRSPRILIVRTDRIGDVVLTLPMARVLRARFPGAHIAMLIRRYTRELVEDCREVDHIHYYDEGDQLVPINKLASILRDAHFDIVFHTYPRFRLALVTWFAGIPVRVGTGYRWYSFLFNKKVFDHRKTAEYHELEYNLRLLDAAGYGRPGLASPIDVTPMLPVSDESWNIAAKVLRSKGINPGKKSDDRIILLHPGSGGSARDWSPEKFGELASRLAKQQDVKVVITGGVAERSLVEQVERLGGEKVVAVIGELSLREFGALVSMATVFVSNSTGPIHIAAAVGTSVVGLYPQITGLSAKRWGPYTNNKTVFSPVNKPLDCTLCEQRNGGPCECMETITVDQVYNTVAGHLA